MKENKLYIFLIRTLKIAGLWIGVAFLISSITFLNQLQGNYPEELSVFNVLLFETICISPWAISTPFIMRIARRFSFEEDRRYKSILVHLLTALLVFCFHSVIQSLTVHWFYNEPLTLSYLWLDFRGFIDMRLMLYIGLVLGIYAIDLQNKNREIRLNEPRLKAQLNKARYRALLNQIQPDFLIDSIDSIERNLPEKPITAENILTDLSDLLRIMLRNINQEEVPIQEDLESFRLYVDILGSRYGAEIKQKTNIDPQCYEAKVPSFLILIPVIEHVLKKVSQHHQLIKSVGYQAKRSGNQIHLSATIEGLPQSTKKILDQPQKKRLSKIREQLRQKFGDSIMLTTKQEGSSISLMLRIPYFDLDLPEESLMAGFSNNGNFRDGGDTQ